MLSREEMREAVLELTVQREREERARQESEAVLAALEAVQRAATPRAAIVDILGIARAAVGCSAAALLVEGADGVRADAAVGEGAAGLALPREAGLLELFAGAPRRIGDLARKDWWAAAGEPARERFRSLLTAPVPLATRSAARVGMGAGSPVGRALIACLGMRHARFTKDHERLLTRLAGALGQALTVLRLEQRNRLLASVIENAALPFAIADAHAPGAPVLFVNDAFERLTRRNRENVLGAPVAAIAAAGEGARLAEAAAAGRPDALRLEIARTDAPPVPTETIVYPVSAGDAAHGLSVAIVRDVTAEAAVERERDEARDRLAAALAATSEAVLVADADRRVVLANDRWLALCPGRAARCRPGASLAEAFAGEADAEARIARLYAGGEREETAPDGRALLVNDRPTADGGAVSVATDVTRLKAAERLLAQRAAAMDAASDGIAIADARGRFLYMNASHARIFGYDAVEDLIGRHWSVLYAPPERDRIAREALPAVMAGGSWRGELHGLRRDGTVFDQEVSLTLEESVGLVCVTRDVTDRRRAEEERTRLMAALAEAQRNEAVDQLAAGIAHDFNNLLSAIGGSAHLAAAHLSDPPGALAHLDRIERAVEGASALVGRLLSLGRRERAAALVDVAAVVAEAAALARNVMPAGVELLVDAPAGAEAVADATELSQIVLNLLINARDAIGGAGGTVRVAVASGPAPGEEARATAVHAGRVSRGTVAGGVPSVTIVVEDTGKGMDADTLARAFEPYFTTKGSAGTGLGLAVAASIVKASGGSIAVGSTPGRGTAFRIVLPARPPDGLARPVPAREAPPAVDLSGRLVLAVDDDADALAVVVALLEAAGAEVAAADHPEDAIEILAEHPESFSLLLTDYEMPGLDGKALAERARTLAPSLPMVLQTGLHPDDPRLLDARPHFAAVILKPVDARSLAAALLAAGLAEPPSRAT